MQRKTLLLLKPISDAYYVIQPNLGLGYLGRIASGKGYNTHILDSGKERLSWDDFAKKVKEERYDIIGLQVFTHEVLSAKKHIEIIKRYMPEATILIGGAHISGDPEGTMGLLSYADFGFIGEAEIGMERFLELQREDYSNSNLLKEIPNLVWRDSAKVVVNEKRFYENLDEIKFPAWDLIDPRKYPEAPHGTFCRKMPIAPIIISRGCPFECTFCAGNSVTGRHIRYRSIKNVIDEIVLLYNEYDVREIHIEDDNFTLKREHVVDFCDGVIKSGLDLAFALPNGVRLDMLDEGLLRLMERAGFYSMALGIESGSDRVLKLMKKSLSKGLAREKINLIKRCTDIELTGFFLIGYPGETESEILETIAFAKSLKLDKASFMFVMPLPGSELWDIYMQKDKQKIGWEDFFYYRIVESLSDIPPERLRKFQRKALLEFYLRPRILLGVLREIKTYSQIKITMKRLLNIFT